MGSTRIKPSADQPVPGREAAKTIDILLALVR
jgi:hypothetical protein